MRSIARKQLCFLVEKEAVNQLMERIRNLVGKHKELEGFYPSRDLGCAFECLCSACSIVYTAFQFLQLKTDDALLSRLSLQTLLDLNDAECGVCWSLLFGGMVVCNDMSRLRMNWCSLLLD